MPSPFPGMDPYLEGPTWWDGFHSSYIIYLHAQLNRDLPEGFASHVQERVYVEEAPRQRYIPDLTLSTRPNRPAEEASLAVGGVAVAAAPPVTSDEPRILRVPTERHREPYLEIRTVRGDRRVVAVIELLSHANKADGRGREEYRAKQRRTLDSDAHLLEIDLLRTGQHTVAAPEEELREAAEWDYLVCLHRVGALGEYAYWPILLPQRLPVVRVPLSDGVPDQSLDLQAAFDQAFDQAYDAGPYRRELDYRTPPEVPLREAAHAAWAESVLAEKGFRP